MVALGQLRAESFVRAGQQGFRGGIGTTEDLGNLGIIESAIFVQQHCGALWPG